VAGGLAFFIGRDRNGDGQLAAGEIEQTQYECGDVLARDVTIKTDEDMAALANIRAITGSLAIDRTSLAQLELPVLDSVGGRLAVTGNPQLVQISLPRLRGVDGFVELSANSALTTVDAPALQRIGGSFLVRMNPVLHDMAGFPQLSRVDGDVQIVGNDALSSVPSILQGVQHLVIRDNPALAALVWGAFTSPIAIEVVNNGLSTLNLFAGEDAVSLGNVVISHNTKLQTVFISADQVDTLWVQDNASLTDVNVQGSEIEQDITLFGNGQLHSLVLGSFFDSFEVKGSLFVSDPLDRFGGVLRPIVINGDCTFSGSRLKGLGPENQLRHVGGTLTMEHSAALTNVFDFSIGGGLSLIDNAVLASVLLGDPFIDDRQRVFGGDVIITGNPKLRNTQLLEDTTQIHGNLLITDNAQLFASFSGGITEISGSVEIKNNPVLSDLGLSGLQTVGGELSVFANTSLPEVDLPALQSVANGIEIEQNQAVRHLRLPRVSLASMFVEDNVQLPACEVAALFAGMGGSHFQSGNDETATCPSAP
jgi:hypothetical protein